jgi:hypothetical protein
MARVIAASGDARRAARLFGAVWHSIDELKLTLEPPNDSDHAQGLADARRLLDSESWAAAWREGGCLRPEAAMAIALAPLAVGPLERTVQSRAAATTSFVTHAK